MYTPSITAVCPEHPKGLRTFFCAIFNEGKIMSTELEVPAACKPPVHAYSPTERMVASNLYQCSSKINPAISEDEILNDLDRMIASYNAADIVQQKALLQLQTLDTVFHFFVARGCTRDSAYFREAFIAQKLFTDLTKVMTARSLPVPDDKW